MTNDRAVGDKSTDGTLTDKRSIDAVIQGLAEEGLTGKGMTDEVLTNNGGITDATDSELTEGWAEAKEEHLTDGEMTRCLTDGQPEDDEAGVDKAVNDEVEADQVFCNSIWILIPSQPILGANSFPVIALTICFDL